MTDETSPNAMLTLDNLSITTPQGQALLSEASLRVAEGEFILLAGASGSGKTTLLRLIAGIDEPSLQQLQISGSVKVAGPVAEDQTTGKTSVLARVGVVFQDCALFDELTAGENVQFAIDHRPGGRASASYTAGDLLSDMGVVASRYPAALSGGERQRVAVARTLALDPPILLFDEPTTGLDSRRAAQVAELIRKTHQTSKRTIIVITHDFQPFMAHGPRIVLLDDKTKKLREIDPESLDSFFKSDAPAQPKDKEQPAGKRGNAAIGRLPLLEGPGEIVMTLLTTLGAASRGWRRPKWQGRYLWHYAKMVVFGSTLAYVALAGGMLGFVFVLFSFSQLPYSEVIVPLLRKEFLAATGYSTYRIVVPLLTSVLLAGKCGAAIAADAGSRRLTHQYEAMRSLGASPDRYLYGSAAIAMVIGAPLLGVVAYISNTYAALLAYLLSADDANVAVFYRHFLSLVRPHDGAMPREFSWVVAKMAVSGLLIAAVAYRLGSSPKSSAADVSRDVGRTIFWASLTVLLLHSTVAFLEF